MALVLALGLVTVGIVSGTMAWLTASSTEVQNTFTDSDINITLTESDTDLNKDGDQHNYKMIPGWTIAKDPKVTVAAGSEDCYVFVKIDKSANYDDYLNDYDVDGAWNQLETDGDNPEAVQGVFYQKVTGVNESSWSDYVLAGKNGFANGYVTVKEAVTKAQMNALTADSSSYPTLTFTAYASQLMKNNTEEFTPYVAWTNVYGSSSNP